MTVVVWIVEGTWQACIDAARRFAHGTDVVLLHVTEEGPAAAVRGGWAGLLGRSHPAHDPACGSRRQPRRRPRSYSTPRPTGWVGPPAGPAGPAGRRAR